jgi:hypothetical protein
MELKHKWSRGQEKGSRDARYVDLIQRIVPTLDDLGLTIFLN